MMTPDADARDSGRPDPLTVNGNGSDPLAADAAEETVSQVDPEPLPEPREIHDAAVGALQADRAEIKDSLIAALAADQVEARDCTIVFGAADRIEGENVRILFSPAAAAAFGVALGLSFALLRRILGKRA